VTLAVLLSVWTASVIGSLHCMAMCGPIVTFASAGTGRVQGPLLHSLGRLVVYVALGVVAGWLGQSFDASRFGAVIGRPAMIVAGIALVAWGVYLFAVALGFRVPQSSSHLYGRALVQIQKKAPKPRAVLLGIISGFLPCGWLWSFAVLAAGSGAMWKGALVMVVFWSGTLPAMLGVWALLGPMASRLRTRLPMVTAITLLSLGGLALSMRLSMKPVVALSTGLHEGEALIAPTTPACHGGH